MTRIILALTFILASCGAVNKPTELIMAPDYGPIVFSGVELPLLVYNDDPLLLSTTIDAVETWNTWMGMEFLKVTTNSLEGEIFVFTGTSSRYNGVTYFPVVPLHARDKYRSDHIAKIEMFNGSTETLVHELGHAVGLNHDPHNRRSIMHPYSFPRYMPTLEAADLAALKAIYLR